MSSLDELGLSPVFGAAIVITLLAVGATVLVTRVAPEIQRGNEHDHMTSVRRSLGEFLEALGGLEPGQEKTVDLQLRASPVPIFGFSPPPGILSLFPSRQVRRLQPSADVYVDNRFPATNFSAENRLHVGSEVGSNDQRTYLKFDLSTLPPSALIVRAKLFLHTSWISKFGAYPSITPPRVELRLVADWSENTLTWNTQPSIGEALRGEVWPYKYSWSLEYENSWFGVELTNRVKLKRDANENLNLVLKCVSEDPSMYRAALFPSRENSPWLRPHLFVVLDNLAAPESDNWGVLVSPGGLRFEGRNTYYPSQTHLVEGDALLLRQWYTSTVLSSPVLVTGARAEGDNISIHVTRYRFLSRESLIRSGVARLHVKVENIYTLVESLPVDNLTLTLVTDVEHEWAYQSYLREEFGWGGEFNTRLGGFVGGVWRNVVSIDGGQLSVTITGRIHEPGTPDIIYTSRVIEVSVRVELA